MARTAAQDINRAVVAGILGWIIPGAGHWYLGLRGFAIVFFLAITLPYATGLALGGVLRFANPRENRWLFAAEVPVLGYTLPAMLVSEDVAKHLRQAEARDEELDLTRYAAFYPAADVAQIYLATAGLLNILAIIDALARAQTGGLPTFYRELERAPEEPAGP